MGAAATPAVLALAGVRSRTRPPGLLVRAAGVLALAFGLIVVSCVLAAWFLDGKAAPSLAEIRQELSANFVLLVFGLSVFLGLVMVVRDRQGFQPETPSAASRLVFSERGRVLAIDPAEIVWIESQGNYQAIRTRAATHLVRRTLGALEGELDPVRFVRVHRRVIVAAACVVDVDALSNGDAEARMADGRTFRVARGRRARLRATLTRS